MRVAFTGHRPNKLGDCYDLRHPNSLKIHQHMLAVLLDLKADKFVSGGALGFDQIAFWTVEKLKLKTDLRILNVLAVPFKKQACKWNLETQQQYQKMVDRADHVIYVDQLERYQSPGLIGEYHVSKMHKRNEFMVNNCDLLIALWDGTKGGTSACVDYAKSIGKDILVIHPSKIL